MGIFSQLFRRDSSAETFVIVGLGNPGSQFAHTRHNVGFDVTDLLCRRWGISLDRERFGGRIGEKTLEGRRVVVCQPQTYMNVSGECVGQMAHWYKIQADHLLVIYDDIDLPSARLRLRKNGSAGTHNGMRSVVQQMGTQEFPRLRVGVGSCPPEWDLKNWVLGHYRTREEQEAMNAAFAKAAECAEAWVLKGTEQAMQEYNGAK